MAPRTPCRPSKTCCGLSGGGGRRWDSELHGFRTELLHPAAGGHRGRRFCRPVRGQGAAYGAGAHHGCGPHQLPPLPADALPGGHSRPGYQRHRLADPLHPPTPAGHRGAHGRRHGRGHGRGG
jgi:hypothetical protein